MPLFVNDVRLSNDDRCLRSYDDFSQKHGWRFRDEAVKLTKKKLFKVKADHKCLYVGKREEGSVTTSDPLIQCLGTDRLKSNLAVVLRCSDTRGTTLSHFDEVGVTAMVVSMLDVTSKISSCLRKRNRLTRSPEELHFDLHVIGGFDDDGESSGDLATEILTDFHRCSTDLDQPIHVMLRTFCSASLNSETIRCGSKLEQAPIIGGIVVHVDTGEICPASFSDDARGPVTFHRNLRTLYARKRITRIYDWMVFQFVLESFEFSLVAEDLESNATEPSEAMIFQYMSNCPHLEPDNFAERMRELLVFHRSNSDLKSTLFENKNELRFKKRQSKWVRVTNKYPLASIQKKDDAFLAMITTP